MTNKKEIGTCGDCDYYIKGVRVFGKKCANPDVMKMMSNMKTDCNFTQLYFNKDFGCIHYKEKLK